jgi:type IV secretory pathway TrbL component
MTLVGLVVMLVIVALLLWAVQQIPGDPTVKNIIRIVVVVAVVLWLLTSFTGHGLDGFNPRLW